MPANNMDGALRRVLKPAGGSVPGCDPELNAAYAEGRLRRAERQKLEAHLAACADCRRLVTDWMAETTEAARAPVRAWWHWRWAVPALAGMAIVGSVVYFHGRPGPQSKPAEPIRQIAAALPAQNEAKEKEKDEPTPPKRGRLARAAKPAAVPPASPPPQAPATEAVAADFAAAQSSRVGREEQASELRKAAPTPVAAAPAGVGAATLAQRRDERAAVPLPDGSLPRSTYRRGTRVWAVSQSGGLFRSTDSGATWQSLEHPATAPLVRVDWDAQQDLLIVEDKDGRSYRVRP